jgi:glutamyl-tRNA reductase
MIQTAMRARRNRALFLIDIAVPRDVESSVGDIENVYLFNIDDLKQVVSDAHEQRSAEIADAQRIAEEAVQEYLVWWRSRDVAPLVIAVRQRLEAMRLEEIAKLRARSPGMSERDLKAVDATMRSYMQKVAHSATEAIKSCVETDGELAYERLEAIRLAFGLDAKQVEETLE